MSFRVYNDSVKAGDKLILYLGFDNMLTLCVKQGQTYQTKFGVLYHDDIIGKKFGSKIQCPKGHLYILHPTPELWTINLPHRTQILYSTDISMIITQLDIKPGSVVIESGTGSASLSHALIRSVAPNGKLHTFEFHEQRADIARREFADHDVSELVIATHRDVCSDGFGVEGIADAVFLDLPSPWLALPHAKKTFKSSGGRICTFSPCIEQVQTSCEELEKLGFSDILTLECLARKPSIKNIKLPDADLGFKSDKIGETGNDELPPKKVCKEGDHQSDNVLSETAETGFSGMCAVSPNQMAGHTGFLTFASLHHE